MELKVNLGLPWEKLAQRLSLTKQRVLDLVGLLDLPDEIKEDIRKKKLTERHDRALRQLLDKAEVLREVFNFIKDKKLTGEQTLELVQKIKGEPGFTIEESYNELKNLNSKKVKTKKEFPEIIVNECDRILKAINKFKSEAMDKSHKEILFNKLLKVKKSIDILLKGNNFYD
ncbi:MAG: hypothetical protein FJW63_00395 [Actinobacteria bacterium]|nr:hypothetical protein [Actinomycetota bacterium]